MQLVQLFTHTPLMQVTSPIWPPPQNPHARPSWLPGVHDCELVPPGIEPHAPLTQPWCVIVHCC